MTRKLLIGLALVLVLLIAAALLVPLLVDEDKLLETAATALHEQTGATLTVDGDTSISVFPTLAITLTDAAITLPEKREPDFRVGKLQVGARLLPLLVGRIEVGAVLLEGLRARIESVAQDDTVDTSTMTDSQLDEFYASRRNSLADSGAQVGAAFAVPLALRVQRLTITDAQLDFIDPAEDASTRVEIVRLLARDLNLDGTAIPLEATVLLPGDQPIEVRADGHIQLDQQQQKATLNEFKIALTGATAEVVTVRTDGVIDLERQSAELQLALDSGELRGSGTLRYAALESPVIDSTMTFNMLDPALLALAGPTAPAPKESDTDTHDAAKPLPLDALRTVDARTSLSVERAVFGTQTLQNLQFKLRALDGVVTITDLTGELHGGKLAATATLNGKHNNATLTTKGSVTRLDLAAALAAAESEPILAGNASLNWQLDSNGRSIEALTAALHGPIKLTTEKVVLQGTSVEKLLCQAVALTNKEALTTTFSPDTQFQTFTADVQVKEGKAQLNPLLAALPGIALTGEGSFDLLAQEFDVTFNARLSEELEQVDHACRVSKRLTAIDWPVVCSGSVNGEPAKWCKVDTTSILTDLTINEGREKLEKKAGKLLNKWFNNDD